MIYIPQQVWTLIPLGTMGEWEQRRSNHDQTAWAYLNAIAGDHEAVQKVMRPICNEPDTKLEHSNMRQIVSVN